MDERQCQLQAWMADVLGLPGPVHDWSVVAGDASSRRYFRGGDGKRSWIVVDAPPQTEKNEAFLQIREQLSRGGVRVPALEAGDLDLGFLVLEDLGDDLLLAQLSADNVDAYYTAAMELLLQLQQLPTQDFGVPDYNEAVLTEELSRFPQWFCERLLGLQLGASDWQLLKRSTALLVESAQAQPQVLVHRDFHSRNLLILKDKNLATIDFQDAIRGPVCYDLVSLLKDCYVSWPPAKVRAWALAYRARLQALGHLTAVSEAEFLRWFDWIGLQRHIKVLGNFARLAIRDGKPAYLRDIPLVLHYIVQTMADYPEFTDAHGWFANELQPRFAALSLDEFL